MTNINFSAKATVYERDSLVQKAASVELLNLLSIQEQESVQDLGCGTGVTTGEIARITQGAVVGIDVSPGMIKEAVARNKDLPNISFRALDATEIDYSEQFDVIYCNSAFQWFSKPDQVLTRCRQALKANGRIGVQAPATSHYCPNFLAAVRKVQEHPDTGEIFSHFQSPWFFGESKEEYIQLFENCGLQVVYCEIKDDIKHFSTDQTYQIFQSGAENGYLNQDFYAVPITSAYIETFRRLVKESIQEQVNQSCLVELLFVRVYLIARK